MRPKNGYFGRYSVNFGRVDGGSAAVSESTRLKNSLIKAVPKTVGGKVPGHFWPFSVARTLFFGSFAGKGCGLGGKCVCVCVCH